MSTHTGGTSIGGGGAGGPPAGFGGFQLMDPVTLERECRDRSLPADWFGRVNVFEVPLGKGPGTGRVLMRKQDLDALDLTADHDLTLLDAAGNRVTLKRLTLLRATRVIPGAAADPLGVYLCELADRRWHLARVPVDLAYNLRTADGADYLPATLTGGAPWTWQQVADDLTTALGLSSLALPFTPDATPQNLAYFGGWAWDAYCSLLDRLACAAKYDPTADAFSVVRLGDADAVADFDAARSGLSGVRTWDARPVEPDRGRRPEKARVLFARFPAPADGSSPYYAVDVTLAAAAGVEPGSVVTLFDDLSADGAGTPANAAACATRAGERAADWLRKRLAYERRLGAAYRDHRPEAVPDLLGAAAGGVLFDARGGPPRTEVRSGPDGLLEGWRPAPVLTTFEFVTGPLTATCNGDGTLTVTGTTKTFTGVGRVS